MDKTRILKELSTRIDNVRQKILHIKLELSAKNKELESHQNEIKKLEKQIDSLSIKDIIISEHAYLRYFERVLGYNLEEIKKELLTEEINKMIETLGNSGKYPNKKGFRLVLKNGVVVTIEN